MFGGHRVKQLGHLCPLNERSVHLAHHAKIPLNLVENRRYNSSTVVKCPQQVGLIVYEAKKKDGKDSEVLQFV